MSSLEESLVSYLNGIAGLTALVSDRITPVKKDEGGDLPYLTYQRITSPEGERAHSGLTLLHRARIQFTAWASTYAAAKSVADQLASILDNLTGSMGTTVIEETILDDQLDSNDPETGWEAVIIDAMFLYK